ncbi:MAG: hypothetical protein AB1715_07505 [Acidobacteriota bacterium]
MDEAGRFRKVSRIDDSRLAALFSREVLAEMTASFLCPDLSFPTKG